MSIINAIAGNNATIDCGSRDCVNLVDLPVMDNGSAVLRAKSHKNLSPQTDSLAKESRGDVLFEEFSRLVESKSYVSFSGCVLEHILSDSALTDSEKLYYILADALSLINKNSANANANTDNSTDNRADNRNGGNNSAVSLTATSDDGSTRASASSATSSREFALSSEDWAVRLGCSRSLIFTMQASLEEKGYFLVKKEWDHIGRNKRNVIIPTLPNSLFNHLNNKSPDRILHNEHLPYNSLTEDKLAYFDRTKLFIRLNYHLLLAITKHSLLTPKQKVMWLGFYARSYKNYMTGQKDANVVTFSKNDSSFSFIASYQEMALTYSCSTKLISKFIRSLERLGFVRTEHFYTKKHDCAFRIQERQDQSLWKVTISLPHDCALEFNNIQNRSNLNIENNYRLKSNKVDYNELCPSLNSDDYIMDQLETGDCANQVEEGGGINFDPPFLFSGLLLNKDLKSNSNEFKSNLEQEPKVSFDYIFDKDQLEKSSYNETEKKYLPEDSSIGIQRVESDIEAKPKPKSQSKPQDQAQVQSRPKIFNIVTELIKENLKTLPRDKAEKARKFAYSLSSKKLATGYASRLTKHELAKELIHHAASWKPKKLGNLSRVQEIDTALAIGWRSMVNGTWKQPLTLAKAQMLQYEYECYFKKYQQFGIISAELSSLEAIVNRLLGGAYHDLARIIKSEAVCIDMHDSVEDNMNLQSSIEAIALTRICDNELREYTTKHTDINSNQLWNSRLSETYRDNELDGTNKQTKQDQINETNGKTKPNEANQTNQQIELERIEPLSREEISYPSYRLDTSKLTEEEKHLKLTTDYDSPMIIMETIGKQEYHFKFKIMEVNEEGDLVITATPASKAYFSDLQLIHTIKSDEIARIERAGG